MIEDNYIEDSFYEVYNAKIHCVDCRCQTEELYYVLDDDILRCSDCIIESHTISDNEYCDNCHETDNTLFNSLFDTDKVLCLACLLQNEYNKFDYDSFYNNYR